MTTGAELLGQVLDAPDDDAPKLVYADWLEQQDQPIAAAIRAHLHGAPEPPDAAAWIAPIRAWVRDPIFERGMIGRIYGKTGHYVQRAHQQDLVAVLSLIGVRLTMLRGQSVKLAACATLALTTELFWWDCQLDDELAAALADSPHLVHLRSLTLEKVRCSNTGLRALARSRALRRVRHLGLPAPVHLGAFDAAGVLDVIEQLSIESLDLTGLNKVDLAELGNSRVAARLTRLAVMTSRAGTLARSRGLSGLSQLSIDSFGPISDDDITALVDNPAFANLQGFSLRGKLDAPTVERLRARFGDRLTIHG